MSISYRYDLAECDSEILLICFVDITHFQVYRVADLTLGRVDPLPGIGGGAIFINNKRCLALSHGAVPPAAGDTVVTYKSGHPSQYHLGTGSWSPLVDGWGPCSLIYHIYNCCRCGTLVPSLSS